VIEAGAKWSSTVNHKYRPSFQEFVVMLFATVQEVFGNLFLGGIVTVAVWIWIIHKTGNKDHAKKHAAGWLRRVITSLFKS
jgi:hypothetical protein